MAGKIRGLRSVLEWQRLLQDPRSLLYRRLQELYGGDPALAREPAQVCRRAVDAFGESYGWERNVIIVRSTGRVNLMGMHVDHRGGSVNSAAIKETFFVAEPRDDDLILLRDVNSRELPEEQFRIRECLPRARIADWESWCHDEHEKRRGDPSVTWSNYVRAAVLYLQHRNTQDDGTFRPALWGMNVMVCGNIPRAAGLSTSSAIVVAAAEACIRINGLQVAPAEFIDWCGYGEWYVGTRGGSGDHAAIKLGQPGAVVHITSFPLTWKLVPFPREYRIVLANSMVEAKKLTGARNAFNSRVAAYIFGAMLIRGNFPRHATKIQHLRDVNPRTLNIGEADIYRMVKSLPESSTRQDVLRLLPDREREVRDVFRSHDEPPEGYKVRQIVMYGISECLRADIAAERLEAGNIAGFGEVTSISHDGDRVARWVNGTPVPTDNSYPDARIDALIADLQSSDPERVSRAALWRQPGGYNVSVPEIDLLVDIARAAPGAVGARLVGAGLGGSIVAVVEAGRAQALVDSLAEQYYRPRNLPVSAEIVAPVAGSGVLDID